MFDRFVNNLDDPSIYSMDGHYINNVFQLIKLDDETLLRLEAWLKDANDTKNNGFYLGVDNDWRSPEMFGQKDYQCALECIQVLKTTIEPMFDIPLTDEDLLDYLNREVS
jgi:hypothetical protein